MEIFDGISVDSGVCNGKPVVKGTRISVQTILEFIAAGDSPEEILAEYPSLTKESIRQAVRFASQLSGQSHELLSTASH